MTAVPDLQRKRPYKARPSRRVSEPTRPFAIRLGGEQADWLDHYLADLGDFSSKTQKLSAFVAAAVERESGISGEPAVMNQPVAMDALKDELEHLLKRDLKKWLMRLLNDRDRVEAVQTAHSSMSDGGSVDDALINNILQGFESEF